MPIADVFPGDGDAAVEGRAEMPIADVFPGDGDAAAVGAEPQFENHELR